MWHKEVKYMWRLKEKLFLRSKWNEEMGRFHFSLLLRTDITEFVLQCMATQAGPIWLSSMLVRLHTDRRQSPEWFLSFFSFSPFFPFKTEKLPLDLHKVEEETLPLWRKVTAEWEKHTNCSSNKICEKFKWTSAWRTELLRGALHTDNVPRRVVVQITPWNCLIDS